MLRLHTIKTYQAYHAAGYICMDCGCEFMGPCVVQDNYGLPGGYYEQFDTCPACGSAEIEDAYLCNDCGATIPESQSAYGLCKSCEAEARRKLKTCIFSMSPSERVYLNDLYDGRDLDDEDVT